MNEQTPPSLADYTKEEVEQAKAEMVAILSKYVDLEDIRLTSEQVLLYLMRK